MLGVVLESKCTFSIVGEVRAKIPQGEKERGRADELEKRNYGRKGDGGQAFFSDNPFYEMYR